MRFAAIGVMIMTLLGCTGQPSPPPKSIPVEIKPTQQIEPATAPVETPTTKSPADYFPLPAPKTLTYSIAYETFLLGKGTGKAVVVSEERDIDGVKYTAQTTTTTETSWDFTRTALFRRTEDGVVTRDLKETADRIFLPLPWDVGTKWTMKSGDGVVDCEITAIEDTHCGETTYAGCLKVESVPQAGSTETRWFAPEVGLVKTEVRSPRYKSTTVLIRVE